MILAVVITVASMVICYVVKRPELAPAFPVDVPPEKTASLILE